MEALTGPTLRLEVDPRLGTWAVPGAVERARTSVSYRVGGRRERWDGGIPQAQLERWQEPGGPHGATQRLRLTGAKSAGPLEVALEFALPAAAPLLLWRMRVKNTGTRFLQLDELVLLDCQAPLAFDSPAAYVNGHQSWSVSGAYGPGERQRRSRLGPFTAAISRGPGWGARGKDAWSSELFGVVGDRAHRRGLLLGFLSQRHHFGSVRLARQPRLWAHGDGARLDPGAEVTTDWAVLQPVAIDAAEPLGPYLAAVAAENGARKNAPVPAGWCSWYQFFNQVSEADLARNLETAVAARAAVPLSLFQLDDGFQTAVGDWFSRNERFPSPLGQTAARIRDAGLQPGLWLAPFSAVPRSKLVAEHPGWVLRDGRGRAANAAFVFDTWTRALDVTHPEVRAYVKDVVRTATTEWGFSFLKLDFLYMGGLAGQRYDPRATRASALRAALEDIRQAAGEGTFLLGCGCPIGSGVGVFDGMRISADVAPSWHPQRKWLGAYVKPEPDLPSARNAIHNTLTRAFMHRRFWVNDPDCLLVREDQQLSLTEARTLATAIALCGGNVLVSDDLAKLAPGRRRILEQLLPVTGEAARALDWFDAATPTTLVLERRGAWVVGLFNHGEAPARLVLPLSRLSPKLREAQGVEFWSQTPVHATGELRFEGVPAHGCVLVTLRSALDPMPYAGSDLHFTQHAELVSAGVDEGRVTLALDAGRHTEGWVWLRLPFTPVRATCGGDPVAIEPAAGLWRVRVRLQARTLVEVFSA